MTTQTTAEFTTVLPTDTDCTHPVLSISDTFETNTVIHPEEFVYDAPEDIERGYSLAEWIVESCRDCKRAVLVHYV